MNRLVVLGCLIGCGDGPICQTEQFVAILTSEVSLDNDPVAAGVQTTIRVRASVDPGETVTLDVFTASGASVDTSSATVATTGIAVFDSVTLSNPTSRLVASVDVACGSGSDELLIPVSSGCELRFDPIPEVSSFYAPAGVLNALSDLDAAVPGLQAKIIVNTAPHARVDIFDDDGTGDRSFAIFDAGETGFIEATRTLGDGPHSYRAICIVDPSAKISARVPVVIDSVAPTCEFRIPAPGTTITPSLDEDMNTAGIQLLVSAHVSDDDVIDEPTSLAVTQVGGGTVPFITSPIDDNGNASGSVTLTPVTTPTMFNFVFGARDHAHNACEVTEPFISTD